jgi:hypothetical protein
MCRLLAHRVNPRQRSTSVAFGAKWTLTEPRLQKADSCFTVGGEPVRLGLVASLARPGGNLTGTNFFIFELGAKRLEALRELVPGMARLAVLVDPSNAHCWELKRDRASSAHNGLADANS